MGAGHYEQMAQLYRDKLSHPGANTEHLRTQIHAYEKQAAEHHHASEILEAQIQWLRDAFKF